MAPRSSRPGCNPMEAIMDLHDMRDFQVREAAIELCLIEGVDPHARVFAHWDKLGHGALCEQWENKALLVSNWINVMKAVNTVARRYNEHDKEAS